MVTIEVTEELRTLAIEETPQLTIRPCGTRWMQQNGNDMELRRLGPTGLQVSVLGLGCVNFGMSIDADQAAAVVHKALEAGITFFDTAEAYGQGASEEHLGAALGKRREEVVIATKFGTSITRGPGAPGSRYNVIRACEGSLRRLGTDYIDVFYLHWPDATTPIEETLDAMNELVHQGKVRYIAASNLLGWHLADADHTARAHALQRFVANQIEWNLLARGVEREVVPACRHFDVGIVAYLPLASGMLTGKYKRGEEPPAGTRMSTGFADCTRVLTEENFDRVDHLSAVAEQRNRTLLELAVGWLLSQAGVSSVLVGATTPEQVEANAKASAWRLTTADLAAVEAALGEG